MPQETQTDPFLEASKRVNGLDGSNPTLGDRVSESFDRLVRSFDRDTSLTPAEMRRARRFGATLLVSILAGSGAITGITLATGPNAAPPAPSPYASEQDKANLAQAVANTGPNERIVGSFTIDERGEGATEGLAEFLAENPSIKVDPANIEFSQWSANESGKALNGVQPNETIQVTLDDINNDGLEEVVLQRPPESNQ